MGMGRRERGNDATVGRLVGLLACRMIAVAMEVAVKRGVDTKRFWARKGRQQAIAKCAACLPCCRSPKRICIRDDDDDQVHLPLTLGSERAPSSVVVAAVADGVIAPSLCSLHSSSSLRGPSIYDFCAEWVEKLPNFSDIED